jgi:methionyl-tRNA formyltransferase
MRVLFAGTPEFAEHSLRALIASRHSVAAVLTQPDRPAGRGQRLTQSPVKQRALIQSIPVLQPLSLWDAGMAESLKVWEADVLVVVAYGQILPLSILTLAPFGALNVHASLLPRWRGAAPIQRALLAGDEESGICLMQMEEGLDTGPVGLERRCPIQARDTTQSLHDRLAHLGAETLIDGLDLLEQGRWCVRPQTQMGVTYAQKILKTEAEIDWSRSAREIERQIRAFNPFPIARTGWRGEILRFWESEEVQAEGRSGHPGEIDWVDEECIRVHCGSGVLRVTKLQRSGGVVMTVKEFLRGSRLVVGDRLGEVC